MPAFPDLAQPRRIAIAGENLGDLFDIEAILGGLAVRAVLAAPVDAFHRCHELRELRRLLRVGGCRHRQRVLEHVQLTPFVRRQLHAVELRGAFGEVRHRRHERFARARADRFGVDGDVGVLHPASLIGFVAEAQDRLVGFLQERACVLGGARVRGRTAAAGSSQRDAKGDGRKTAE
jgi:hypothetical protein